VASHNNFTSHVTCVTSHNNYHPHICL